MSNHFCFPGRMAARQGGFSLIELLIAMAMGLVLILGVVLLVINMGKSFRTQDQVTQISDNERFMLTVLDNTVHAAGYFVNPVISTKATVFLVDGTTFKVGQFISGVDGAATAGDTLNVRLQSAPGDTLTNCQGDTNTTSANVIWANRFYVNAKGQLACVVSIGGEVQPETVLIDNVMSLKVLYGVDTDADGSVDTYLNATAVTAGTNSAVPNFWASIVSVRLTVTLRDTVNSTASAPVALPNPIVHTITLMNQS